MKICITGDFYPINIGKDSFTNIESLLDTFDYRIVNFECALCKKRNDQFPKKNHL